MSDVATFEEFTGFNPGTLGEHDIALLNLRAAFGLPGTDPMPLDAYLDRLDEWAERVRLEICRHLHRYDPTPNEPTEFSHGDSLGRFLCWYMLQVLQRTAASGTTPTVGSTPTSANRRTSSSTAFSTTMVSAGLAPRCPSFMSQSADGSASR